MTVMQSFLLVLTSSSIKFWSFSSVVSFCAQTSGYHKQDDIFKTNCPWRVLFAETNVSIGSEVATISG